MLNLQISGVTESMQIAILLSQMALAAEPTADGLAVRVRVPPTRSDVLHACDVIEVCSIVCFGLYSTDSDESRVFLPFFSFQGVITHPYFWFSCRQ